MHFRGYHLKANRLFELFHKPSAAFMAADSRTILMHPMVRNVFDLAQCDRHYRMHRWLSLVLGVWRASTGSAALQRRLSSCQRGGACEGSGHDTTPPSRVINSRRLIARTPRPMTTS